MSKYYMESFEPGFDEDGREKGSGLTQTVTFRVEPGRLGRLFGRKTRRVSWAGTCTVWHKLPEFRQAGVFTRSWLSDIWSQEKYLAQHGGADDD